MIRDIPSPIERDTYRQQLARLLRVDERTLNFAPIERRQVARRRSTSPRPENRKAEKARGLAQGGYALEAHALGVLMRRPDMLYRVDRKLQELGLSRLYAADFQHADHQSILRLLQQSVDQDMAEPLNYVLGSLSLPMMEVADELLARTGNLDVSDERVMDDLVRGLITMRLQSVRQNIEYLRYLMEDAQQQGDLKASQYQQTMVQHTLALQRLNHALGQYTSRITSGRVS